MELLARLESLIEADENDLRDAYQNLAECEALQGRQETLRAELRSMLDGDEAVSAELAAVLRRSAAAFDVSAGLAANRIQDFATSAREQRSALTNLHASVDQLRAAVAAGDVVGPLPEVEEALATASDRAARQRVQMEASRQVNEELRQHCDRTFEAIAEMKAGLVEDAPPAPGS